MQDWGDLNQSTLSLMCKCIQKEYPYDVIQSLLQQMNYSLPEFLHREDYPSISPCTVMIRSLVLAYNPVALLSLLSSRTTSPTSS